MAYLGKRIEPYSMSPIHGGMGEIDWSSIVGSVSNAAASIVKSVESPYSQTTPYGSYAAPAPIVGNVAGLDMGTILILGGAALVLYMVMKKK